MTTTKSILTLSSVAVALMFGGGVYLYMNLGMIAKNITEKLATRTLGVPVSIGSMDINLKEMKVDVQHIRVSNPPGFDKPNALTIKNVNVTLEALKEQLITFKDIEVNGTDVYLEVHENGTNLKTISDGLQLAHGNTPKTDTAEPTATEKAEQMKVIIRELALTDAKLHPSVTLLSAQDLSPVIAPDLNLRGIGEKENGVLAREAIAQVWARISRNMNNAAGQAGFLEGVSPEALKDMGQGQMQQIKQQVQDKAESLKEDLGKALFGE